MENVVSARRLRKSVLNNIDSVSFCSGYINKEEKDESKKIGIKEKFLIKSLISSILLFVTIFVVNNYGSKLLENKIISRVYDHYKFNFSTSLILENFEGVIKSLDRIMGDIIPNKIKQNIIVNYCNNIKPFILNFSIVNLFKSDESEVEIYIYNEKQMVGNEEIIDESIINLNLDKGIYSMDIALPTIGVVTSKFGDREEIFEGVNPYHTGIDIGNVMNTDITSSTDGVVKKVIQNDKYYGNYIEIQENGIIFKYAHLNEVLVEEGKNVYQGQIIGKMGSTGMSTGPHLHFEIIVENQAIDPEKVLNFNENKT